MSLFSKFHTLCVKNLFKKKFYFIFKKYIYFRNRTIRKARSVERFYFEGHRHRILSTDSIGLLQKICKLAIFL